MLDAPHVGECANPLNRKVPQGKVGVMPYTETVGSPWLGFWTDHAAAARKARKASQMQDPVNAALWALSGFDTTCGKLADLREDIAARYPDPRDEVRAVIDNAIQIYTREQAAHLRVANNYTERQIDDLANNLIQAKNVNRAVMMALACGSRSDTHHVMLHIVTYAITFAAAGNFGAAPFNRFADIMHECYQQLYPNNYKTPPAQATT